MAETDGEVDEVSDDANDDHDERLFVSFLLFACIRRSDLIISTPPHIDSPPLANNRNPSSSHSEKFLSMSLHL